MKKLISIFALGLALLVSCNKEDAPMTGPINTVEDLYTVPSEAATMPALSASNSTWSTDRRYFDLTFGDALSTTLVGYDALLTPGQYVLGADEIGNAILAKTTVKGKAAKQGFITVNEKGGKYAITAQIDGEVLAWTGELPFTPDPAPVKLTDVLAAQANTGEVTTLTLNLATTGVYSEFDMTTYQNVWKGEGGYLALDLNTGDKYLVEGSYKACAEGGVVNTGEFGIGYDTDVEYWGTVYHVENWGTCWWDVKDGVATATKITDGLVTVSSREEDNATIWTIFWGKNYPKEYVFEGAIPALTKPKKPAGPVVPTHKYTIGEPQPCSTSAGAVVDGVKKYPITITDASDQEVAYLEFVMVDGSEDMVEGDYVSTEYASEAGQLANGYYLDFTEMGWGIIAGGSYYMNGEDKVYIDPGVTVSVVKIGTGAFEFISTGFDFPAAGPNYVAGEGGDEGDDDVTGDVVLKLTSGLTYTMEDVTAGNTDAGGAALSGMTLWRVTVSDGSGTVAAFDLGTAEGSSDLAGTYTVMSYPDAVGKAGNGWGFAAYNMFGGCYFVVDGAYYFIPADATIKVSNNADGTIKIKFEGSIQKDDYSDGGTGGVLLNNVAKG